MAVLAACATGNFTAAATWALVDSTSYNAGNDSNGETLTTTYAGTRSSAFTPGAITIDGIGVRLGARSGTTGTMSVNLELDADDTQVAGTEVTINCSDLPAATQVAIDGGWIFFKFAAPVTLPAGAIQCAAKTSSATQVILWRDGTADNIARYLRTTTTQAPAAGDDLIIAGEWTAAGAVTARTVTMNETATTDYGSAPTAANSLLTPGLAICNNGTLTWGVTAATNYYLKMSNSIIIYRVGTWNHGTTGTPIPRDSTAILELDPAADGDYGFLNRGGTRNMQGLSRTSGKNVVSCKLNTDEAAAQTVLGVDTDTGWLNGDGIAIASTSRTASECETRTLSANANAADMTVSAGLTNAHSGTSPTQAEVILLTRNVKFRSATSTLMAYVYVDAAATDDWDWVEVYYVGKAATNKKGIEVGTTTGSFNMQFCSLHDFEDNGFAAVANLGAGSIVFSSNVMWNLATVTGPACQLAFATSSTNITIDSNILIRTTAGNGWTLSDVGGTFTNNTVAGAAAVGFSFSEAAVSFGTFSGNTAHSNATDGVNIAAFAMSGVIATTTAWRNNNQGFEVTTSVNMGDLIVSDLIAFGNATNIATNAGGFLHLKSPTVNSDSTFTSTSGLIVQTAGASPIIIIDNGDFSTVSGIKTANTADITVNSSPGNPLIILRNTKLGAATEVGSQTNLGGLGFVSSQKHDQTAGNHKTWVRYGTVQTDSTIFNTASPSMRMTPNNASGKLESATQFGGFKKPCNQSSTVTVSVYVRKSTSGDGAEYNGNQPRLIQKANPALGQSADIVLDTMTVAVGSWEQLIAESSVASGDDGAWEFVVDCDGTAGWANLDDFA